MMKRSGKQHVVLHRLPVATAVHHTAELGVFPYAQIAAPDVIVQIIVVLEDPLADLCLQKEVRNSFRYLCKQQCIIREPEQGA
ncbi:hypothetical protein SDC9_185790 [bioreactor metagenome]|uniref:Uncharacterized protein n=1 Tax=bioreactor metagenome TaxID=1076179 RepID=A0A645HI50_9ZZZZ